MTWRRLTRDSLRLRDGFDIALLLVIWALVLGLVPLACLLSIGWFDLGGALLHPAALPAAIASLLVSLPLRVLVQADSYDARRPGSPHGK